jgi:hypothetical protein
MIQVNKAKLRNADMHNPAVHEMLPLKRGSLQAFSMFWSSLKEKKMPANFRFAGSLSLVRLGGPDQFTPKE